MAACVVYQRCTASDRAVTAAIFRAGEFEAAQTLTPGAKGWTPQFIYLLGMGLSSWELKHQIRVLMDLKSGGGVVHSFQRTPYLFVWTRIKLLPLLVFITSVAKLWLIIIWTDCSLLLLLLPLLMFSFSSACACPRQLTSPCQGHWVFDSRPSQRGDNARAPTPAAWSLQ